MQLKTLTDDKLLRAIKTLATQERQKHAEVVEHLEELVSRDLHLKLGYSSVFEYCIKELWDHESTAARRSNLVKIIKKAPEVATMIKKGEISPNRVSQVQTHINRRQYSEGKQNESVSKKETLKIIREVGNLSEREAQRKFHQYETGRSTGSSRNQNPEQKPGQRPKYEEVREVSAGTQIKIIVNEELLKKLERIESLTSHQNPTHSQVKLLEILANFYLEKKDPARMPRKRVKQNSMIQPQPKEQREGSKSNRLNRKTAALKLPLKLTKHPKSSMPNNISKPAKDSESAKPVRFKIQRRYIPKATQNALWTRAKGRCEYKSGKNGRKCASSHCLQVEHIHPVALGGSNDLVNLALFCRAHNLLAAKQLGLFRPPGG